MRELEQQRKGRNKNTIIDYNYISSNRYRKKFDYISNDKKLNKLLYKILYLFFDCPYKHYTFKHFEI